MAAVFERRETGNTDEDLPVSPTHMSNTTKGNTIIIENTSQQNNIVKGEAYSISENTSLQEKNSISYNVVQDTTNRTSLKSGDPATLPELVRITDDRSKSSPEDSQVEDNATNGENDGSEDGVTGSMLCLVCGDRGSGYHYSAFSCEGCKGFFKRTVQKHLEYTCKFEKMCPINRFSRNSCQYCRYERCMQAGMRREAVREDRAPGGKNRNKRPRMEDLINAAVFSVLPSEPYKDDLVQALVDAGPDTIPSDEHGALPVPTIPNMPGVVDVDSLTLDQMMSYGYVELKLIIRWARKVTGFSELNMEDQMTLLKSSFMELNVLRLAYRSRESDGKVRFSTNITMSHAETVRLGWGQDLIKSTLDFVERLKDISVDHTEFCILNAIVLTYPDATGIIEKESVRKLQSNILDSLRKYIGFHYPHEPRRYGKMLLRLPALRTISSKAAEQFLSLSAEGKVQMTTLVAEMMC